MAKFIWLDINGDDVSIQQLDGSEYVALGDLLPEKQGRQLFKNWLNEVKTLEFLASWEVCYNPMFNMDNFLNLWIEASKEKTDLEVDKWIEETKALGIYLSRKNPGKIYMHKEIAFQFKSWLHPVLHCKWIQKFQELMEAKRKKKGKNWDPLAWLEKQMPKHRPKPQT